MDVTLTFHLDEEVTPEIFAGKIAYACARGGAIREGESVSANGKTYSFVGWEDVHLFGEHKEPVHVPSIEVNRA